MLDARRLRMNEMQRIFRVQDRKGIGPYKPGFTVTWYDEDCRALQRPAFYTEFGTAIVGKIHLHSLNKFQCGCGFRTLEQLHAWFSNSELDKLFYFGYSIVTMVPDAILAESEKQLVFARKTPFTKGCFIVESADMLDVG